MAAPVPAEVVCRRPPGGKAVDQDSGDPDRRPGSGRYRTTGTSACRAPPGQVSPRYERTQRLALGLIRFGDVCTSPIPGNLEGKSETFPSIGPLSAAIAATG